MCILVLFILMHSFLHVLPLEISRIGDDDPLPWSNVSLSEELIDVGCPGGRVALKRLEFA